MSEYDELLKEAITKGAVFQSTAREYISKMYYALRNENPRISPADARDRIEKDCIGIWSKRTILDALPDEAKDLEKQKAGRLGQKKRNSAAFSAAPQPKEKIMIDTQGRTIENTPIVDESSVADPVQKLPPHRLDKPILKECPTCQELHAENQELKEALRRNTVQHTADKIAETEIEILIPKEKYQMIRDAMDKSKNSVCMTCDENRTLVRADPDVYN